MAKFILLLLCIVVINVISSTALSIQCDFKIGSFYFTSNLYRCYITNNLSITTRESAIITSISGTHQSGKTISDVVGFRVESKTLNYFPRGLETFLKNIKRIDIRSCGMKEIHQEDLKPFPKLVELTLIVNSLEVLEGGLFEFNPNLEHICLSYNKISHIVPNIFDNLSKLGSLYIQSNTCINKYVYSSTSAVKNLVQELKSQCINSEFSSLNEKLDNLKLESKTLSPKDLDSKLATFEQTFNSSKFFNFRPLSSKYSALKNLQTTTLPVPKPQTTTLSVPEPFKPKCSQDCLNFENKLGNLTENLQFLTVTYSNISNDLSTVQNDIKRSQTDLKDIKLTQDDFKVSHGELMSLISTTSDYMKESDTRHSDDIKAVTTELKNIKSTQEIFQKSLTDLDSKLTNLEDKIRTQLENLKAKKVDNPEDLSQLEAIDDRHALFEGKTGRKLQKIEKELEVVRFKILTSMDAKVKASETRLLGKIEEMMEKFMGNVKENLFLWSVTKS